jgi:hypothetical protein
MSLTVLSPDGVNWHVPLMPYQRCPQPAHVTGSQWARIRHNGRVRAPTDKMASTARR